MSMKIFLTNLGKYNEGYLIGKWVKLPIPADKLKEVLDEIGINERYEEVFISDYETSFEGMSDVISEYTSITALNELAEEIEALFEDEEEKLAAILECEYCRSIEDVREMIANLDDYDLIQDIDDDEKLGYYYAEEVGCIDLPKHLRNLLNYFNYEAYGRDIRLEGGNITYTSRGCLICNR